MIRIRTLHASEWMYMYIALDHVVGVILSAEADKFLKVGSKLAYILLDTAPMHAKINRGFGNESELAGVVLDTDDESAIAVLRAKGYDKLL